MINRYRHRVGVRAEICFELELDSPHPTRLELRDAVVAVFRRTADQERGFPIPALGGEVFPEWTSVDPDLHREDVLEAEAVRHFGWTEVIPKPPSKAG